MRKKRKVYYGIILLVVMLSMTACGNPKMENAKSSANFSYDKAEQSAEYEVAPEENFASTSLVKSNEVLRNTQEKIIRRINMDMETQEFEQLISAIDTKINQLSGYVESSNISGKRYYSNNTRNADIVARVPKERLDEFVHELKSTANVVNLSETTENVTLNYIDTESRKKALEIEQERLFSLLEKVEKLEDIISLETRLSNVRYELQNYETQLRNYDNLVEYSTVTMYIREVERLSPNAEETIGVWARIKNGFRETMYNISDGAKNFLVWFIVNLPYFMIWGAILTVIGLVGRKLWMRSKLRETLRYNSVDTNQIVNEKDEKKMKE